MAQHQPPPASHSARRKPYLVNVFREQRWIYLDVPELGAFSDTLRMRDAEREARDLVAVWLDVDPDRIRIRLRRRSARR